MRRPFSRVASPLVAALTLLLAAATTSALRLGLTSNGSLGAVDWTDSYYTHYLNTDTRSIDLSAPPGIYTAGTPDVARLVAQPGGPDIVVYDFTTFTLGPGVQLYIVGSRPAAILATGAITIAGTVYVQNGYAGGLPQASASGLPGSGPTATAPGQGGAGPGYYVAVDSGGYIVYEPLTGGGGGGGGSGVPGQPGFPTKTLVDVTLGPQSLPGGARGENDPAVVDGSILRGGSGGGAGGDRASGSGWSPGHGSAGGAGGGALLIDTPGNMTVNGAITADGQPGASGFGGGGGGGAGGYLIIQVEGTLTVAPSGSITALGGAGGAGPYPGEAYSGGGNGGGGRIDIDVATPNLVNQGTIDTGLVGVPSRPTLGVSLIGNGTGTVTSSLGSIDCGTDCTWTYSSGQVVTLTATPAPGSLFAGWQGDADCLDGSLTMDGSRGCAANFVRQSTYMLDFNGDVTGDVFRYNPTSGAWSVDTSISGGFSSAAGSWSPGWTVRAADFNADGLSDFFVYNPVTGDWYKCINDGSGGFNYYFGAWSPGWDVYVLNLDGDGRSDVFVFKKTTGAWYQCMTDIAAPHAGFTYKPGAWSPGWSVYALRLNADSLDDIFVYNTQSGAWFQCMTDGAGGFANYLGGQWSPNWEIVPGDFNGDTLGDIFVYNSATGAWFICSNNGNGFAYSPGSWSAGWTLAAGDLNADNRTDIFVYSPASGHWFECFSTGAGFTHAGGQWSPGWEISVLDLNADNRADVVTYNSTSGAVYRCMNTADGVFTWTGADWGAGWQLVTSHQTLR